MRRWCAKIQYPGKQPVMFGTVMVEPRAPLADVEAEMVKALATCLPDGYKIIDLVPGQIWFQPEAA